MVQVKSYEEDKKYVVKPTLRLKSLTTNQPWQNIILEPNGQRLLDKPINTIQTREKNLLKRGTYRYSKTIVIAEGNNGNPGAYKTLHQRNEKPIIDFRNG